MGKSFSFTFVKQQYQAVADIVRAANVKLD